jgi:hypothetical protein
MSLPEMMHPDTAFLGPDTGEALPAALKASSSPLPTRIAFIGNYLPRECGIATFTTDLCTALAPNTERDACLRFPSTIPIRITIIRNKCVWRLHRRILSSYERAADFLNFNGNDLVCLQHEYGIYGGRCGGHILTLLRKLKMPLVTTLHTVLREPDANQRGAGRDRTAFRSHDCDERAGGPIAARSVCGSRRKDRCDSAWRSGSSLHGPQLLQRQVRHGGKVRSAHLRLAVSQQRH